MRTSKLKTQNVKLALLVLAYLGLATLYSALVPLGEGPDEPGHAAYAFFLARAGRIPVQRLDPRMSDVRGEGHQPPLAYALAALTLLWLPREQRSFDVPGNPRFVWNGGGEVNAVAHGSREFWPWGGDALVLHVARLSSVALGAATVVFTYLAAQRLATGDWRLGRRRAHGYRQSSAAHTQSPIGLLAAALVAFNPQFLFMSALLTNDALLIALSAALLWLVLWEPAPRRQATGDRQLEPAGAIYTRALLIGVVLGLALVTKQSALLLAPVALLATLRWDTRQRAMWQRLVGSLSPGLLVLGSAALVSGWWYWRNWRLYGDPLGLSAFTAEFATQPFERGRPAAWLGALWQLHESFWARFGWMNVAPPAWVLGVYTLLVLVALFGFVQGARSQAAGASRQEPGANLRRWMHLFSRSAVQPFIVLPLLALAWVVSFAFTAGLVAWQGRLLFPALPALAVVLACGLLKINGGGIPFFTAYLLPSALVLLALWLPFGVIAPAYPRYTLPQTQALAQLGAPVFARFGEQGDPGVELRGWRTVAGARSSSDVDITLMWHALGRQRRDWSVFVHLVDVRGEIVAGANGQPNGGVFPMKQWVAGDWVADKHTLALPAALPPGRYTVRVGLFNERGDGGRAGRYDPQGKLRGDSFDLGVLTVAR